MFTEQKHVIKLQQHSYANELLEIYTNETKLRFLHNSLKFKMIFKCIC